MIFLKFWIKRGEKIIEIAVKKSGKMFFNRMVKTYTILVYTAIVLTGACGYVIFQINEGQNAEIIQNTHFLDGVDVFEDAYSDFIYITDQLKRENTLNLFTIMSADDYTKSRDALELRLVELADSHSQKNIKTFVYRDDVDEIISRTSNISMDKALAEIGLTSRELRVATEYLKYDNNSYFCVFTDENLIFISQNLVGSKNTFTICYREFSSFYDGEEPVSVIFWENAQNVLDLRKENIPDAVSTNNFFYVPSGEKGEIVHMETENAQVRLFKSEFFDIVYCTTTQKHTAGTLLLKMIAIVACLIPLYYIVEFIVKKVTITIYKPIDDLLDYVSCEFEEDKYLDCEIESITEAINKIQQKNIELREQAEQMMDKIRQYNVDMQNLIQIEEIEEDEDEQIGKNDLIENESEMQEKFEQYIIDHISEDIGLRDLSEHFNLSFAYTSTLFKTKMQMNFKEYVSYQRYLHSLEIMKENPKMKIADVAEQVGISNVNTFIRIFKKYNDITPKQYMSIIETEIQEEQV